MDLEDELPSLADDEETVTTALTPEKIHDELERVQRFVQRVERLPRNGKAERLLDAVRLIQERKGKGSGKIVIFSERIACGFIGCYLAQFRPMQLTLNLDDFLRIDILNFPNRAHAVENRPSGQSCRAEVKREGLTTNPVFPY